MKKKFLEKVKKLLLEEKNILLSKKNTIDVDMDGDEIDEIQGNLIASVASQLSTRDINKVNQINNALKKIADNTYGLCEDCGEDILDKRLEANPYFTICISCAEEKELENKKKRV